MHIAWLTPFLTAGRASGGDIASQDLIDGLRDLGHRVVVHGHRAPQGTEPGVDEVPIGDPVGEASTAGVLTKAGWLFRSLRTGESVSAGKFRSAAFCSRLPAIWAAADLVVVDHVQLAWLAPSDRPFVAVAHNVESAVAEDRATRAGRCAGALLRREARLLARTEQAMARRASAVIALTRSDADHFLRLGARQVVVAPVVGMPLADTGESSASGEPPLADVGLLGLWTWEPNRRGLDWFVDEVVPLLPSGISIAIAGRGAGHLERHPRLRVLGSVPDADAFLRACRLHVIPSVAGGGVQVKTINAIARGVPLVVTPVALRGIEPVPATVTMAGTPRDFAEAVQVRLASPQTVSGAGAAWQQERRGQMRLALAGLLTGLDARG